MLLQGLGTKDVIPLGCCLFSEKRNNIERMKMSDGGLVREK